MFCSKCGNPLSDDAKFCGACGAPVNTVQEDSPVLQQPAGISDEVEGIQMLKPENVPKPPVEAQNSHRSLSHDTKASVKKSKKGLVIGFSIGGGILLTIILAVVLIFVFGLKDGSKGSDSFASIVNNEVVYDDEYTYYLSEDDRGSTARIMRIGNEQDAEPEVLYEADQIKGDGWGQYPLGALFLWEDKICFLEVTNASETTAEYGLFWVSKDGKESGTLASYEQLGELMSNEGVGLRNIYYYEDALVFSNGQVLSWLDLKTGEFREQNDVINADKPIHFVAYDKGYYYYFAFDTNNEVVGGTLYRKKEGSEAEKICVMPELDYTSESDHATLSACVPKGEYLYFADETIIFRIHMENGDVETLASYEGAENRFAVSDAGLYYFKDMSLCLIDFETLEEAVFDLPEDLDHIPDIIYAGPDGGCWLKRWEDSFKYYRFIPDEEGGSYTYFGEKTNETEESDQTAYADAPASSDITPLYAAVVERLIAEYGSISFGGGDSYECYAAGVFKIDLLDFNQDGTDELVVLYTPEGDGIFPFADVWTVKNGEAVQLFSKKSKDESHESKGTFSLYENAGFFYIPVYDSLDCNPVCVHLYGFDEQGEFGEIYQYENNAFYMNQLPDGMKFTEYEGTLFYTNTQLAYYDNGFENAKEEMMESLQTDMKYMLNVLGVSVPEAAANWLGVYRYDDGHLGQLYLVNEETDSEIHGICVFECASGEYDKRDFVWSKRDSLTATEPFENGGGLVYYHLEQGRIVTSYPDGWWPDREYVWVSDIAHMDETVQHPALSEQTATLEAGFYGVWVCASKDYDVAEQYADALVQKGFAAGIYETTDWSNLNTEAYYVVSAGEFSTENAANNALELVQNAGYANAYIKYTGEKRTDEKS